MLKARALFENSDNSLFANQFVNIHLKIGLLHNVLTIPSAAVQRGSPGTFAYVVGTDNKVSVRKITLGPSQGSMTAVTTGLDQGESVVVEGSDRLRDGASVVVPSNAALHGSEPATPKPERRTRDKQ
jgi:multidrug efflux system membrane fusion protein